MFLQKRTNCFEKALANIDCFQKLHDHIQHCFFNTAKPYNIFQYIARSAKKQRQTGAQEKQIQSVSAFSAAYISRDAQQKSDVWSLPKAKG